MGHVYLVVLCGCSRKPSISCPMLWWMRQSWSMLNQLVPWRGLAMYHQNMILWCVFLTLYRYRFLVVHTKDYLCAWGCPCVLRLWAHSPLRVPCAGTLCKGPVWSLCGPCAGLPSPPPILGTGLALCRLDYDGQPWPSVWCRQEPCACAALVGEALLRRKTLCGPERSLHLSHNTRYMYIYMYVYIYVLVLYRYMLAYIATLHADMMCIL